MDSLTSIISYISYISHIIYTSWFRWVRCFQLVGQVNPLWNDVSKFPLRSPQPTLCFADRWICIASAQEDDKISYRARKSVLEDERKISQGTEWNHR